MKETTVSKFFLASGTLAIVFMGAGCSEKSQIATTNPSTAAAPVVVARAEVRSIPVEIHAIGQAQALKTVSVKPQVSGELVGVHFREGQEVRKGDLLFTIDKSPFQAALDQAQGTLAKDKAQAANSAAQAQRYAKLFREGISSKEQYDQTQAQANADRALVAADEAAVETARLQVQYCTITSPIDGRTGTLQVNVGNLVKANDVPVLVVINQIAPIYVDFSIPEKYLGEVKKYLEKGRLPVEAFTPDDAINPEKGTLTFYDNAVDPTTGTIKLRGTFPNTDRRLWPGQFLDCVVRLSEEENAVVVPSAAVQTGQKGQFVYIVKPDNTVELSPVTVGTVYQNMTAIDKGVQAGQTVVTDGQIRIFPGAKVQIVSGGTGR